MIPEHDRKLIDKLKSDSTATWQFRLAHWLKYPSDREAAQLVVMGIAIFVGLDIVVIILTGPIRDFSLFAAGATLASIIHILNIKRIRRYWNDHFGRDIYHVE
jgi:hypothetical protein